MTDDDPCRRALPAGYDDPDSPFVVPRIARTHFQCVSAPEPLPADPLAAHDAIADAAVQWAYDDHVSRHGPGRVPDPRRRALPVGYDDPESEFALPRMIHTHYQCVTVPDPLPTDPQAAHEVIAFAAERWAYDDYVRRNGPIPT